MADFFQNGFGTLDKGRNIWTMVGYRLTDFSDASRLDNT